MRKKILSSRLCLASTEKCFRGLIFVIKSVASPVAPLHFLVLGEIWSNDSLDRSLYVLSSLVRPVLPMLVQDDPLASCLKLFAFGIYYFDAGFSLFVPLASSS